jgi:endonuclease/exonuclease/phosphatase family metal-dependent hydrolase
MKRTAGALFLLAAAACASAPFGVREQPLRVMSYNIQYGNEGLDSVIAVINAERPDIVGLQELDVHWAERSKFVNQAELLAKGTGMQYRFARIYQLPGSDATKPPREFGVGILSRYPIVSFTNHPITRLSTQEANPVPSPLPGFLDATVDVNGTKVRVFDVHLDFRRDPSVRAKQVAEMVAVMAKATGPVILMGDMNARPNAAEIEPLFRRLRDTWPYTQGPGLTGPARNPAGKIDYVLVSDEFRVSRTWVPKVYASDHFPVVADLVLVK